MEGTTDYFKNETAMCVCKDGYAGPTCETGTCYNCIKDRTFHLLSGVNAADNFVSLSLIDFYHRHANSFCKHYFYTH